MRQFVELAVLGASSGAIISLTATGLVLVYRSSGVLNFAAGAMGALGTFVYWDLKVEHGWPTAAAIPVAVLASGAAGLGTHLLVMRPMRQASGLVRLIATLAVLVVLQSALNMRYGTDPRVVPGILPRKTWHIAELSIGLDRVVLLVGTVVLTAALALIYTRTRFGWATSAVAENDRAARALGISPDRIAAINWTVGGMLAGLTGVLLAPIVGIQLVVLTELTITAIAAALLGEMSSFGLTLLGAIAIGIIQAEIPEYVHTPGWTSAAPFLIIVVVMVVRGRGLSARPGVVSKLPAVGAAHLRPISIAVSCAAAFALIWWVFGDTYVDSISVMLSGALVLLSIVVVTGYAGQLSLCQFTLAGVGAVVSGMLVSRAGLSLAPAMLVGGLTAAGAGLVVGLPALRTRGISLAVATLAVGVAVQAVWFDNPQLWGAKLGSASLPVGPPTFLGINVDPFFDPRRYAVLCLVVFVVTALLVNNMRRGRSGRRLISVRGNDRAAAAVGISVFGAKLYAFALSGFIAAMGGTLLVFRDANLTFAGRFDVFQSINGLVYTVLGGVGFISGALVGALSTPGSVVSSLLRGTSARFDLWVALVGAVLTIITLQMTNDGVVPLQIRQFRALLRRRGDAPPVSSEALVAVTKQRVVAQQLEASGVTVAFGGVVAVSDVSLHVEPAEIVGVIGPNGAGKTTLIDVLTGFVRPQAGRMRLGDRTLNGRPVHQRARAGLGRSFQSLELFDDLSVGDNLRAAADSQGVATYLIDLVHPKATPLPASAAAAVHEFDLERDLGRRPSELSYGRRRLVGIARAVCAQPSVLCLDEPAAGLSSLESRELGELLRRLAREWGMGILLVEHDVDLVMRISDRVVAMNFGEVIADGTPAEVRDHPAVIAAYLGSAAAKHAVPEAASADVSRIRS